MAEQLCLDFEEWRKVKGWPYEVSSFGRVKSLSKIITDVMGRSYPITGKILKPAPDQDGYLRVNLADQGQRQYIGVHILICTAFNGPKPSPDYEVAHWDSIKTNNVPGNLRWATDKENGEDASRLHKHSGTRNGAAKLTEDDIHDIRQRSAIRGAMQQLAREYGVSYENIKRIKYRKIWKHIP